MQLEVIRLMADALNDADTGVAAQLATMPRDTGDAVPADPVIVEYTSDAALVQGEQLDRGQAILVLVTPDGPVTYSGAFKHQKPIGTFPVACTVVHRGDRDPAGKVQDCLYVLRAIGLSLTALFASPSTARVRNNVVLMEPTAQSMGLVQDDGIGGLGAVVTTVRAFDQLAHQTA